MRPVRRSPAHHSSDFAELVCSNSFGALSSDRAAGLLQEELRRLGSLVIRTADDHAVPAGGALAVDRGRYSAALTEILDQHPLVTIERREQMDLPEVEKRLESHRVIAVEDKVSEQTSLATHLNECMDYIHECRASGGKVLVHCLAGAHRAGTTGCLLLMKYGNLPHAEAVATAKKLRPVIDPIGRFPELLRRYDAARPAQPRLQAQAPQVTAASG